jgi:ATP-dependent protease Clp ATPase subunit
LVLPHAQQDLKKLVLAFAPAQSKHVDAFDDITRGKGRGLIMLLRGPPGVGKALTAKSVAEIMEVPLYVLSAGDVETNSDRVEDILRDILIIVLRWGAVLLPEKADVFVDSHDKIDLERYELVAIFLRLLE